MRKMTNEEREREGEGREKERKRERKKGRKKEEERDRERVGKEHGSRMRRMQDVGEMTACGTHMTSASQCGCKMTSWSRPLEESS